MPYNAEVSPDHAGQKSVPGSDVDLDAVVSLEEIEEAVLDGDSPIGPKGGTAVSALRHRTFRIVFFGFFASNIGTWMQNVVLGAYAYDVTHSSTFVGIVIFAQLGADPALPHAGRAARRPVRPQEIPGAPLVGAARLLAGLGVGGVVSLSLARAVGRRGHQGRLGKCNVLPCLLGPCSPCSWAGRISPVPSPSTLRR